MSDDGAAGSAATSGENTLLSAIERVLALAGSNHVAEALPLGRNALASAGDGSGLPATLAVARALNQLGMFLFEHAYARDAAAAYIAALGVIARAAPEDRASEATLRNNLGQAFEHAGDLPKAREELEASLAMKQAIPDSPLSMAMTKDNLASVLTGLAETERAEQLIREALETFEAIHGYAHSAVATALGNLGRIYAEEANVPRARATYLRALDTHLQAAGLEGPGTLVAATNLAALCLDAHDDPLANEVSDLLLALGGDRPDARHHAAATAVLGLARRAFDGFRLGLAERLAARACALLEASEGPRAPDTLTAMTLLANVHRAKGNTAAAERLQMQVIEAPDQTPLERAQRLLDFGKSVRARGRGSFAVAIEMFERALDLLREHPDSAGLASALGNLAELRFENGESGLADTLYDEALAAIGSDEGSHALPWLLHNQAMLRYHVGRHDEALAGYTRARDLWTRRLGPRHPFVATTDANLALVHWAVGSHGDADRAFASAHELRAPELARMLAVGSERERLNASRESLGDLYKVVSFHFATGAAATLAATMLLRHKGGVLDAMVQSQARLRKRLDAGSRLLLDQLADVQRRMADAIASETLLGGTANPQGAAALQAESNRLQTEIGYRSAFGQSAVELPAIDAVRGALPAGAVLLELFRYPVFDPIRTGAQDSWRPARYAAMLLPRDGAPSWIDLGDAAEIDAAVQAARERLSEPEAAGLGDALQALSARVLAPIEPLLGAPRLLLVAPDGALNLVPFGVLGNPPLADRCDIGLLLAGRELLRPHDDEEPETAPVAIVDPDFGSGGSLFEPLPGTRHEARTLASLWPGLRVFEGAAATADALRAVMRPSLLHIATHGHFEEPESGARRWEVSTLGFDDHFYFVQRAAPSARADAMLHGGLAFAGANDSVPGRPVGIVSAAELAQLDLRGTALVVLSACETGLGTAAQGEEFAGLRRAFALAGSRSQLTSLWWVDDAAATAFMSAFYRRLHEGVGRAEALAGAQREIRNEPQFAHPAYWASFVIWGDAGPLPGALRATSQRV